MKATKAPRPLATSDEEIARLFTSLEEDAPPRDAEAALIARLDAIDGRSPPPRPPWPLLKNWAIRAGLLVAGVLGVTVAVREGPTRDDGIHVPTPAVAPSNPAASPLAQRNPTASEDLPPAPAPPLGVAVEDLPAAPSSRTVPTPSPSTASAEAKDSFREQLAMVESARHSLSQGRAEESLTTLRRYDVKYPSGLFTTEARVVRIEALIAAGQPETARALARGLLASDPHGPYADRLRSLFPQTDGLDR
ncbi:MAG: hypothetical protein JWM74_5313 [Myxococcaceae bacterium]|nr:hypothetical protein [Myxococcaceae bacterium]